MKVVIAQVDTLPPVLPVATQANATDTLIVNQGGTIRTVTLAQVLAALTPSDLLEGSMAVEFVPTAVLVGTGYEAALSPVGLGAPRKALLLQNTSQGATVYVFFGPAAPEDDTQSWELGPNQKWPPDGVIQVSQDGVWLRASGASTPVVMLVG